MKKIVILSLLAVFATGSFAKKPKQEVVPAEAPKQEVVVKETPKQEVVAQQPQTLTEIISYALGANIGDGLSQNLRQYGIQVDWEFVKLGLGEAAAGRNQFSQEQMQAAFAQLDELAAASQKVQEAEQNVLYEKNKAEQNAWLEKNKKEKGVITTPSGLQYKVITLGKGAKPTATDKVKVHYHGTLIDGTVFDSSVQRGEPISFPLNGVIAGWTEGVQLMPVGSKFIFYIPSELGYGERGAGGMIGPGATLIFEVELLGINVE